MVAADSGAGVLARVGSHSISRRAFFWQSSGRYIRRRVRGVAVRRTASSRALSLARAGTDDGWIGPRGNNAGPADHGAAIRRVHGRLEPTDGFVSAAGRDARRVHHYLGNLRAMLSLDLSRRSAHRTIAREQDDCFHAL